MNQVMEEYTFIYLNLNAILKTIYRDLIKIINADLWLRYVWKKKYWGLAHVGRNVKYGNSRPGSTYRFIIEKAKCLETKFSISNKTWSVLKV